MTTSFAGRKVRIVLAAIVTGCGLLFAAGCVRYGGLESLTQRVEGKLAEYRPHPIFVPTPLSEAKSPDALPVPPPAHLVTVANAANVAREPGTACPPGAVDDPTAPAALAPRLTPALGARTNAGPTVTATPPPTATPVAECSPTATSTPVYAPAQPKVALSGLTHYWQSWNNCGPATLATDLSYFGSKLNQADVAATLRPDPNDKNVNPDEMVAFAQAQGFHALARVHGDPGRLRLLLSNGLPVLVETWMEPKPNDGMGHYRLMTGYDDAKQEWIAYDSYDSRNVDPKVPYSGIRLPYGELAALWPAFDRLYIVVYTDQQAAIVAAILGRDMDAAANLERARQETEEELKANPKFAYGWFNLGSELVSLGRLADAAQAYDRARELGLPWRMLWYQFGPFPAYEAVGRYREMMALADATLRTADNIEELYYWKGRALHATDDLPGARQAWERALQLNKNYHAPAEALAAVGY